jgi:hypothetical protein
MFGDNQIIKMIYIYIYILGMVARSFILIKIHSCEAYLPLVLIFKERGIHAIGLIFNKRGIHAIG